MKKRDYIVSGRDPNGRLDFRHGWILDLKWCHRTQFFSISWFCFLCSGGPHGGSYIPRLYLLPGWSLVEKRVYLSYKCSRNIIPLAFIGSLLNQSLQPGGIWCSDWLDLGHMLHPKLHNSSFNGQDLSEPHHNSARLLEPGEFSHFADEETC